MKYDRVFDWINGYFIFELEEPFQFEEEPMDFFGGPIRYKVKAFKGVLSEQKVAITPEKRQKLVYDSLLKHLKNPERNRDSNKNPLPEEQLRAFREFVQTLAPSVATSLADTTDGAIKSRKRSSEELTPNKKKRIE